MKRIRQMGSLVVALTILGGCAFKGSLPGADEIPTFPMDGALHSVQITWEGRPEAIELSGNEFVARSKTVFAKSSPISIAADVPDSIRIKATFREDSQQLGIVTAVARSLEGNTGTGKEVGVSDLVLGSEEGLGTVQVNVDGMQELLRSDREQRLLLSLDLQSKTGQKQILLTLATPPSDLREQRRDGHGLIKSGYRRSSVPWRLVSQAISLELVERVTYRNDSIYPVRLNLPFRVPGEVISKIRIHEPVSMRPPHPQTVSFTQNQREEDRPTESEFYVIPGVPEILDRWPEFASKDRRSLILPSDSEIEIGLYVPMTDVLSVRSHVQGELRFDSLQVNARAICPPDRNKMPPPTPQNGDEGANRCYSMARSHGHSQDAVQVCRNAVREAILCHRSGFNPQACLQAALLDHQLDGLRHPHPNNGTPWPIWMTCARYEPTIDGRLKYIHVGWVWEPVYATFRRGEEFFSARAVPDDISSLQAVLTYETGNAAADQEGRHFPLFSPTISIE